jgi:hypothetical protein
MTNQIATKADVRDLKAELKTDIGDLRASIKVMDGKIYAVLAVVERDTGGSFGSNVNTGRMPSARRES